MELDFVVVYGRFSFCYCVFVYCFLVYVYVYVVNENKLGVVGFFVNVDIGGFVVEDGCIGMVIFG